MLKTVRDACSLNDTTMEYQVAGGVDSLIELLAASDHGEKFFESSYPTQGMLELASEGLLRLSGGSDQAVFELSQAMGGGKTHLMAALGLAAQHPEHRARLVTSERAQRIDDEPARVAVFDGREMPDHFLWGEIAQQLGAEASDAFRKFWRDGPKAPGKSDWKGIIGNEPTLILFDELPPYFRNAHTVTVGNATLADVLTTALSNLFAAALELDRCCVVLANLADSYANEIKGIQEIVREAQKESNRQARKITPVSLDGGEIYAILRKRLFASLPSDQDIDEVAEAFAAEIKKAEDGGYFAARSLEQVEEEVRQTYPFHPSYKHLVALFKDNPNFRETRGLLQFSARVARSVWNRESNDVYLMGTQHLDANDDLVADELQTINPSLRNALIRDVADQGSSHAEEIDANLNSDAGSQVATLLFSASLTLAVRGHAGLRRAEVIEYLVAPNRKPDEFAQAFDDLRKTAWYLHHDGEIIFFKDTENLTKRIQKEADQVARARVEKEFANRLEAELRPRSKLAYQTVYVMPRFNEVQLSTQRALIVVKPDNSVPPEQIQQFFESLEEKNHLLVLTGESTHLADRVETRLREVIAVEGIRRSGGAAHNESMRQELEQAYDEAQQAFTQALQGAFNRLLFPGAEGLMTATIPTGLRFGQTDETRAERQIEELLTSTRCDEKLVPSLDDPQMYIRMAESYLWPKGSRHTRWADVQLKAKSNTLWPWMPGSKGLDQLKAEAQSRGVWRVHDDGRVECGPFPKEKTSVNIPPGELDPETGETVLEISPQNAGAKPVIHVAEHANVSTSDPVVEQPEHFRTKAATLYFLAVDPTGEHETGDPKAWVARLKIRHEIHKRPQHREVELQVAPDAEIRYTTDGTSAREGSVYTGPFPVPDEGCTVLAFASAGEAQAQETFRIPPAGTGGGDDGKGGGRPHIDADQPAALVHSSIKLDTTNKVFEVLSALSGRDVRMQGVRLHIGEGEYAVLVRFNHRVVTLDTLGAVIRSMREAMEGPTDAVQVDVRERVDFGTGDDLIKLAEIVGIELTRANVEQG